MATPPALPQHARVVIVGGGVIGTSTAYHLALMGWTDIVLLERHQLTAGTTWHAAGLMVTYGSTSETSTEIRKYTRDLYGRLEAETGQATGFMPIGFIEVASDRDRLEEFRRVAAFNRYCGVDVQEISPREVQQLFPLARVDDIEAGFYVKEDGRVNPVDVTMALGKGARMRGVKIFEGVPATGVLQKNGRVTGVSTPFGDIQTDYVVNCAGLWARELGAQSGVAISNQAAEHYYLITEAIKDLPQNMPVLEDPSSYGYYRQEGGGLMVGLFEPVCAPWKIEGAPTDTPYLDLEPDWERMGPYLETAMARVPITSQVGMKKFFCGPESFTPDLKPIVGEAPELRGYFVAAGLNSIGILTGGGLGRVMAHWIINGLPDVDVTGMNIDRVLPYQANPEYRRARTVESLGMVYKCHYPTHTLKSARDARRSPFHDRLAAQGAYFIEASGWESPAWFAGAGQTPDPGPDTWARPGWWSHWAAEHKAARENVIVMDMSFMGKFLVQGRDAGRCLNRISANDVDGAAGMITYTQWLNPAGRLEADLTVTKLADDRFFVVVTDTMVRHAETWMKRNIPDDAHAVVTDVTSGYAQLNVQGPRSRDLLQSLTSVDLVERGVPVPRRASRSTSATRACSAPASPTWANSATSFSSRPTRPCTSTTRSWPPVRSSGWCTPACARSAACAWRRATATTATTWTTPTTRTRPASASRSTSRSPTASSARRPLLERKAKGPLQRRLVSVLVRDPAPQMFHAEIVLRDGRPVGYVRAASYGHTLGGAVGLAFLEPKQTVDEAFLTSGTWEVEIAGTRYPATVSGRPLYDPKGERTKM